MDFEREFTVDILHQNRMSELRLFYGQKIA